MASEKTDMGEQPVVDTGRRENEKISPDEVRGDLWLPCQNLS